MIKRSQLKRRSSRTAKPSRQLATRRRMLMEGLEKRELLAVFTDLPTAPAPDLDEYDVNRNVGTTQSASQIFEQETSTETGVNDSLPNAQFVNLGTGAGQLDTIDLIGTLPTIQVGLGLQQDIDSYAFDLRGGDILDVASVQNAGSFLIRDSNGLLIFESTVPVDANGLPLFGDLPRPVNFPLQSIGNSFGTIVIPTDGRYTLTLTPFPTLLPQVTSNPYGLGLRAYRPITEQLNVGDSQILYLDFDGGLVDNLVLGNGLPGFSLVPSFQESLPLLGDFFGAGDVASADQIIDRIIDQTIRIFEELGNTTVNGDYSETANPGDYGIRILNSRDHGGMVDLSDPRLSRLMIGGSGADIGLDGLFGIAQSVDVGNFDMSEFGLFALDAFGDTGFTILASVPVQEYFGDFIASVVAHEAGHIFGMMHTNNASGISSLSDAGGTDESILYFQRLLGDGVYGTDDDIDPIFNNDFYQIGEFSNSGFNRVRESMVHALSTGTVGTLTAGGRVFEDLNGDGSSTGDPGLAGVTVFVDTNRNFRLDSGEATAVSDATGSFTISSDGDPIVAVPPGGFVPTTPVSAPATTGIEFGFIRDGSGGGGDDGGFGRTGDTYADFNENGAFDPGEELEGIYVYLDLDGDDRPDLGEPATRSLADGSYELNAPGPGTYIMRVSPPDDLTLTTPADGEHVVTTTGTTIFGDFDFIFGATIDLGDDYGDAPSSYGAAGHDIVTGLTIGVGIDAEVSSQPTTGADGDDLSDLDDEDGLVQNGPVTPGSSASFSVTVNNTSGEAAFLQAFIDLNGDGDFLDADEQVADDVLVSAGTSGDVALSFFVPESVALGTTYMRVRLSQTDGLGPTGFATSGEVEDYALTIFPADSVANAIEDSFPDGIDSLGDPITAFGPAVLDVLANDNIGSGAVIVDHGIVSSPSLGTAVFDDAGTPGDLNDDYVSYEASGASGLERFTYFFVTADGVRGEAEVTISLGDAAANADVGIEFVLVDGDGSGTPAEVNVGDRIGVQIWVEDLRGVSLSTPTFVFAAYQDILYDASILRPADTNPVDFLDFDAVIGPEYRTTGAVGTAEVPGIIDEFGTFFDRPAVPEDDIDLLNPGLLATVFFDVIAETDSPTSIVGSPADIFPFQQTLLYQDDDPVAPDSIRYDRLEIPSIGASATSSLQNAALPADVNDDGAVSPIDALLVINRLTSNAAEGESSAQSTQYYLDVSGDGRITALDALQVINYLSNGLGGESEQLVVAESTATDLATSSDTVLADLANEGSSKVTSADGGQGQSNDVFAAGTTADDDDDDDVLDLLADDVLSQWS